MVVEQPGVIRVVRGGRTLDAAVPGHPLEGDLRRRAGPARAGVRARLRRERALLRLLHRPRRAGRSSPSTGAAATQDVADRGSARIVLRMADPEPNHNGGDDRLRPRRPALHRHRRRRRGERPARPARQRAEPRLAARQAAADRPAARRGGRAYTIPRGQPVRRARRAPAAEIYAYGLRNPWRFSFDRAHRATSRSATSARTRSRRSTSRAGAARAASTTAGARGRGGGATSTSRRRARSSPC